MNRNVRQVIFAAVCMLGSGALPLGAQPVQVRSQFNQLCALVPNAQYRAGNALVMSSCGTAAGSEFTLSEGGPIQIGGKCVDAYGGTNRGAQIGLWDCHGGVNQKWNAYSDGTIRASNGLCLAIRDGNPAQGVGLILWDCQNHPSQKWVKVAAAAPPAVQPRPQPVAQQVSFPAAQPQRTNINGKNYMFVNGMGAKCLNIRGGRPSFGADVIGYACTPTTNELFQFMNNGELRDFGGRSACLTDRNGYVVTRSCAQPDGVAWQLNERNEIRKLSSGRITNLCMDLLGYGDIAWIFGEQKVKAMPCNGGASQQWRAAMLFRNSGVFSGLRALAPYQQGSIADVLSHNGNAIVAAGGGNVVSNDGAGIVAAGGGNLIGNDGASIVPAEIRSGGIVAAGGGNIVAAGGGNIVAAGGGNIVAGGGLN